MEQKKFMDIQRLKEGYADGFVPGDLIVIQEKFDGSNAAARYDAETGKMVAFSRRHTLNQNNTLNGFYNYVQELNPEDYKDVPDYVIFGEWSGARNAIIYYPENTRKWYVFDIYDTKEEKYLPQSEVKAFAETHGLTYINTFYVGPFVSWEHVQSFMDHPGYGEIQEGIVIKNQTRLNDPNSRLPFVVKIVGDKFHEVAKMNHVKKIQDPQKLQERTEAQELVKSIVTRRRVEKELYKMRDEGIIPTEWCEQDMKTVARNLPNRIYTDCVKEEPEVVRAAGQYFGKFCSVISMNYAREIILGPTGAKYSERRTRMVATAFSRLCTSCKKRFAYKQTDAIFDENGYGYSTKLVKCKHCGRLNVIRYFEDDSMKLNNDRKYYDYDMV